MRRLSAWCLAAAAAAGRLLADTNPPPSQSPYSADPPFAGAGINQPYPDSIYGADHGGSSFSLSYPFLSPFGNTDASHGVITYHVAPFTPRDSEGVYGMDVWLEQQDASGNWNLASRNGGVSDQGIIYQPINTPNPGPSPAYTFTWTYANTPLPPNTAFRAFIYVYLYNQGGGDQGNFYVASAMSGVSTGAANSAPRIAWTAPSGAINPTQVAYGVSYTISADAQDDNGNLATVSINKNGQPFAYAGGGNGYSGNSQNPTSDPAGTSTFTAWAGDALGAQSPTITWTVTTVSPPPGASVSAVPASGTAPLTTTLSWTTTNATGAEITGVGISSSALSGSQPVTLTSPGNYTYTVWVGGPGGIAFDSAYVTVSVPNFTITTVAIGNGSVTPGGTYPQNTPLSLAATPGAGAWFSGWTGAIASAADPLSLTVTGNLTLYANFAAAQAQSIAFPEPTSVIVPGPVLTLGATASSGLPVSLAVVSGPASLSGNQLTITGPGSVVVQATQPGNSQWLAAAPVTDVIAAASPPDLVRIRFNAAGSDAAVRGEASPAGASLLWSDPTGLGRSPWPSFANPRAAVPASGSFPLAPVPATPAQPP